MRSKVSDQYDGKRRTLYETQCHHCSQILWLPKHLLNKPRYCGVACSSNAQQHQIQVSCALCGKDFTVTPSRKNKSKSGFHFCSRTCKDRAQHHDGIQAIHPSHYNDPTGSRYYRKRALREKGKGCERCDYNEVEQMLDVHHIDGDRSNNKMKNLEVLCVWCHALDTRKVEAHDWNGQLEGH